jgi:hypothetical protein
MKLVIVLLSLLIAAAVAADPIDPDPNTVGVYFDTYAEEVCSDYVGNQAGFVIATHVTYEAIYAWQLAFHIDSQDLAGWVDYPDLPFGLAGQIVPDWPNVDFYYVEPLPGNSPVVVLAEFAYGYYGVGAAWITLGPHEGYGTWLPGQITFQVGPEPTDIVPFGDTGSGGPSAYIGYDCDIVAAQEVSFGTVKALYR